MDVATARRSGNEADWWAALLLATPALFAALWVLYFLIFMH